MKTINNELYLGEFQAKELAEIYGTPLYVYEACEIKGNIKKIREFINYEPKRIHYALFCNNNIQILKLLRKEHIQVTACSPGDVFIATKAGYLPEEIIFSGTNLNEKDFLFLKEKNLQINVDSLEQLKDYCKLNPKSKVGLRLNLKIQLPAEMGLKAVGNESRLGLNEEQLPLALEIASKYKVKLNGIQTYLGTNILSVKPFIKMLKKLVWLAEKIDSIEYIDIGGGFGVDYSEKPKEFDWNKLGKEVTQLMSNLSKKKERKVVLILEPGRSIIARAGTLLTRVVSIKHTNKLFIGTDTCFTHFMRPFLYGAEHRIVKATEIESKEHIEGDVCGNTTLSIDFLGKNKKLPPLRDGDLLAILDVGAYGYSMSSHFLSRPRPAELVVAGKKSHVIREREKISDLL